MKILMVLESEYPPDMRVENEISALIDDGHEVHLACFTKKPLPAFERYKETYIHRKRISSFLFKTSVGCLKTPFYFNFWRRFLKDLTSEIRFDAIHIHDLTLGIIGLEYKRKHNIPFMLDLHENWPGLLRASLHTKTFFGRILSSDKQWTDYEKKMALHADIVITVVEEAKERIEKIGISSDKIAVVKNTINLDSISLKNLERTDPEFTVFYGGGINFHRGLQVVLEAVSILARKGLNIKFLIVGSGSYRKELETLVSGYGIASNVIFYGYKPFNDMLDVLSISDVAIIPHLHTDNNDATIPHKLFQYMYLGKPVVSSDCPPLKRIIQETDSGFIYDADSSLSLSNLLEELSTNKQLLNGKGINGNDAVIRKYNWNYDKQTLTSVYGSFI